MASYVKTCLNKDEKIVIEAKRTALLLVGKWISAVAWFLIAIVSVPLLASLDFAGWPVVFPALIAVVEVISAILATLRYKGEEMALTNKRVVGKKGLVARSMIDIPVSQIESVTVDESFWGRLFHYGKVEISTGDLGGDSLKGVKNADAFKQAVMAQVEAYKQERDKEQADQMAKAMAAAMAMNQNKPQA
ncbi:MAG: PH domain-containing protein [Clostridia bacterium]|nr:PH domain-containing protein [Clostridia bacterium]